MAQTIPIRILYSGQLYWNLAYHMKHSLCSLRALSTICQLPRVRIIWVCILVCWDKVIHGLTGFFYHICMYTSTIINFIHQHLPYSRLVWRGKIFMFWHYLWFHGWSVGTAQAKLHGSCKSGMQVPELDVEVMTMTSSFAVEPSMWIILSV